jgi:hypothetical protein
MAADILSGMFEEVRNERVISIVSSSSVTINVDVTDQYNITALAANVTFNAPSGTYKDGKSILVRIKDNGTSRTLTWNSIFRASSDFSIPSATVINKTIYLQFIYNESENKFDAAG